MLQLVKRLESEGLAHLALRLDRIEPTLLPEVIGRQLGLPASPVTTLAAYSQDDIGVLVIDQLDAVSVTSGRAPQLYECVNEMITTALTVPNLRIVLSCRTFDLENDSRLRRLTMTHPDRSTHGVGTFNDDQIADAVTGFGLDPSKLTRRQVELLRLPLHLALLEGTATAIAQETGELRFNSSVDLLTAFWNEKRREAEERLNHPLRWTQVLDALIDHMSRNQSLWAPSDLADEWESDLAAMVSCNVIVRDRDRLAFFHEVFFDYVFARRYAARRLSVTELLRTDQDLFRRTQVRQLLAYNRGRGQWDRYLPDLTFLLNDTSVRFHLRSAVLVMARPCISNRRRMGPIESPPRRRSIRPAPGRMAHRHESSVVRDRRSARIHRLVSRQRCRAARRFGALDSAIRRRIDAESLASVAAEACRRLARLATPGDAVSLSGRYRQLKARLRSVDTAHCERPGPGHDRTAGGVVLRA